MSVFYLIVMVGTPSSGAMRGPERVSDPSSWSPSTRKIVERTASAGKRTESTEALKKEKAAEALKKEQEEGVTVPYQVGAPQEPVKAEEAVTVYHKRKLTGAEFLEKYGKKEGQVSQYLRPERHKDYKPEPAEEVKTIPTLPTEPRYKTYGMTPEKTSFKYLPEEMQVKMGLLEPTVIKKWEEPTFRERASMFLGGLTGAPQELGKFQTYEDLGYKPSVVERLSFPTMPSEEEHTPAWGEKYDIPTGAKEAFGGAIALATMPIQAPASISGILSGAIAPTREDESEIGRVGRQFRAGEQAMFEAIEEHPVYYGVIATGIALGVGKSIYDYKQYQANLPRTESIRLTKVSPTTGEFKGVIVTKADDILYPSLVKGKIQPSTAYPDVTITQAGVITKLKVKEFGAYTYRGLGRDVFVYDTGVTYSLSLGDLTKVGKITTSTKGFKFKEVKGTTTPLAGESLSLKTGDIIKDFSKTYAGKFTDTGIKTTGVDFSVGITKVKDIGFPTYDLGSMSKPSQIAQTSLQQISLKLVKDLPKPTPPIPKIVSIPTTPLKLDLKIDTKLEGKPFVPITKLDTKETFFTTPAVTSITGTRAGSRTRVRGISKQEIKSIAKVTPIMLVSPKELEKEIVAQKTGVNIMLGQKLRTRQKIIGKSPAFTFPKVSFTPAKVGKGGFVPPIWFPRIRLPLESRRTRKHKRGFEYEPSFIALGEKMRGKAPKMAGSIKVRPITKEFEKKMRRQFGGAFPAISLR